MDTFPGASLPIQSVRTVLKLGDTEWTRSENPVGLHSSVLSDPARETGDFQIKETKTKALINSPQTTGFLRIQGEPETKVAIKDTSLNLLPALRVLSI